MSNENKGNKYTDEFKLQILSLFNNGKPAREIIKEYDVSRASLYKWVASHSNSGSFKARDNRTEEENELIKLRKRNKELEMEVDILKQAALIMGRK